ncbi:hypothetical protein ACHAWF_013216, partial [Thalassiosira exigua]
CSNIGAGKFNCRYLEEDQTIPEGYNYTFFACPYEIGERTLCQGLAGCNLAGVCSSCGVYELQIGTNEVIGECSYFRVCAGGGVDADCTNLGYGKLTCYFPESDED